MRVSKWDKKCGWQVMGVKKVRQKLSEVKRGVRMNGGMKKLRRLQ